MGPWSSLPRSFAPTCAPATWPPSSPSSNHVSPRSYIRYARPQPRLHPASLYPNLPPPRHWKTPPPSSCSSPEFRKRSECEDLFDYVPFVCFTDSFFFEAGSQLQVQVMQCFDVRAILCLIWSSSSSSI